MSAVEFTGCGSPVLRKPVPGQAADEPRAPRSIWAAAALGAVLVHAGCIALAFAYLRPDDAGADLGAPAIAIDVELAAPHRDNPADLPPGPDTDASTASPDLMEQKTAVEQTDLPKAPSAETDDPDRLVTPNETAKPQDDAPKTPAVQTAPSTASAAADAKAMPSPETAREAPLSTAPDLGTGESLRRIRATWEKELVAHVDKRKRVPPGRPRESVAATLRFVIDRTGHVMSAEVAKSSGDSVLDNEALAWLHRADPLPAPPPQVADAGLRFTMPFTFNWQK